MAVLAVLVTGAGAFFIIRNQDAADTVNTVQNASTATTIEYTKVAFIGDQGYGNNAQAVLRLIKNEGTDLVVHSGDFDYDNSPEKWDTQITAVLGADFPYLASVGNHDVDQWAGYQKKLVERLERTPAVSCQGDIGINATCTLNNITVILSGIGTLGENHVRYLRQSLGEAQTPWKICSWHKNQHLMQLGDKSDEVGWDAYDTCRQYGALIATGHEHSYERTYLMANFATQAVVDTESRLYLRPGYSFAFVSGIAGHSIRDIDDDLDRNPWWAAVYTSAQDATYGALFCAFPKSPPLEAPCYFRNINGETIDSFTVTTDTVALPQ